MNRRSGFDVGVPVSLPALHRASSVLHSGGFTALGGLNGTVLSSTAANNTAGSWIQVVASTAAEYAGLSLGVTTMGSSGAAAVGLLSIGLGAAGSEVELFTVAISNHNNAGSSYNAPSMFVPVRIPAGTRVAARIQLAVADAAKNPILSIMGVAPSGLATPSKVVDTIGVSTSTSRGTAISASSTWTQITAATSRPYRALVFVPSSVADTASTLTHTFTVGIGAAGAEVSIGTFIIRQNTAEVMGLTPGNTLLPIQRHIPAGTRLAVKQDQGVTYMDACFLGIPY